MDKSASFLQSTAWAEVQQAYGRQVQLLGDDKQTLAIRYPLPLKQWYWFIPQGNLVAGLNDGALFVRYEPTIKPAQDRQVADVHPSRTLITTLTSEETMLQNMKQKCRYNVRLAEKKGVTVATGSDIRQCYQLLQSTANEQAIRLHPLAYYHAIFSVLSKQAMVKLYFAYYQGQPIATALVVYYGDTVTYLHGGSDHRQRAVMAPHLLHWRIMQEALATGYKQYDWFGISSKWPGVSRFKLGFGGTVVERPGTFEHPLRPLWYTGYSMVKKVWTSS